MVDAIVIGAGVGGLAAAIRLAGAGRRVVLLEASQQAGGKAGTSSFDGVTFDTGPSVLTLPDTLDAVFRDGGTTLAEQLTLVHPTPFTRYRWPDGTTLALGGPDDVRAALGAAAEREFVAFLDYCRRIWEEAAPPFVYGPAPGIGTLWRVGASGLARFHRIDPLRTMRAAIHAQVRDPHLRDVFARFATYNGSDPRRAPATLNCITHVELGLGGVGVSGGIGALVDALVRVALKNNVELRLGTAVTAIVAARSVEGVALADGSTVRAAQVVCNADVPHLAELLPRVAPALPEGTPSTSGWTCVLRARRQENAHQVLFPTRYEDEFEDLFDQRRSPVEPTVYLCAQDLAHERTGWPDGRMPLFAMANAPALPAPDDTGALGERVVARLRAAGVLDATDEVIWSRNPRALAARFPGSRGALYGNASNSMFSAFRRAGNRVSSVPGLYIASGSAHPGGGLPLCLLSGREAARSALEDA